MRDHSHESPTSSSSSSAKSNSSTSSQSTSSQSSSSASTSSPSSSSVTRPVIVLKRTVLKQLVMPNKSSENELIQSSSSSSSGNNQASVKSYRNSPFGLTGHYLTMPVDNEDESKIKAIDDKYTDEDELDLPKHLKAKVKNQNQARKNSADKQWRHDRHLSSSESQSCNDDLTRASERVIPARDLSVLTSSDASNSSLTTNNHRRQPQSWLVDDDEYQPKLSKTSKRHPHLHHHHRSRHYALDPNTLSPAGDAGLDARKCNAKLDLTNPSKLSAENVASCYSPSASELADFQAAQKLKISQQESSNGLLIRFSSIMYATFLVILGCILHVSELRQKSKNSSDHIYTTIVALIGIFWLLFLQTDLQRYKRYASKYILIETIFNDHRQQQQQQLRREELLHDPTARSTTSSSASLVNDRMSMNTEVIFKKTAYKMYQRRAALQQHHESQQKAHPAIYKSHLRSSGKSSLKESSTGLISAGVEVEGPKMSGSMTGNNVDEHDDLVPAYKFLHGKMGANFYLKCGMAAFCFGHVIHEGLRFGQQVYFFGDGNVHCRDSAALVAHLVTPLYSFYQLFMMFKYSNLVINRHRILARFGLMHIIGTSITFWFRTILEEAFEDFVHKMDYFKTNKPQMNSHLALTKTNQNDSTMVSLLASFSNAIKTQASERSDWSTYNSLDPISSNNSMNMTQSLLSLMSSPLSATITPQMVRHLPESYACAQNTLLTTKSMNALPYLYPFTIEYNLLLAATFLSLYFNIGKIGLQTGTNGIKCKPFYTSSQYPNIHYSTSNSFIASQPNGSNLSQIDDNSSAIRTTTTSSLREYSNEHRSEKEFGEYKSNFVVNADCHSANKGLFCGFFVLLVTLVTIVIFFVTINKPTHIQLGIKINLIQEATLTALILMVTLAGFKQVVKLNRNPHLKDKVTTDDVLMLIPLPFFFIHSLLSFRAETASMSSNSISLSSSSSLSAPAAISIQQRIHDVNQDSINSPSGVLQSLVLSKNNNDDSKFRMNNSINAFHSNETHGRFAEQLFGNINNNSVINRNNNFNRNISGSKVVNDFGNNTNSSQIDHFNLITIALNIIVMIEVLVQTNFIIDGMRRCSESRYLRFKKPGRELITFAIILNITYWIVATFETKSVEQYKTEIEYYGPLPYMFISHTTLPVMLFYRYHSSVCLAEIWNRAYKPPKKR